MSHINYPKNRYHIVLEHSTVANNLPLHIDISLTRSGDPEDTTAEPGDSTKDRLKFRINLEGIYQELTPAQRDDVRFNQTIATGLLHNVTIEEMAASCCLSVSTFKRRFRSRYSTSPHSWFLSQRLKIAYKLIISTNVNIRELTMLCGFHSTSHFINLFRRRYSTTPSRLRHTYTTPKDSVKDTTNIVIDFEIS